MAQLTFYLGLMLWNEYAATLLAVIVGTVCLATWVISLLVEWIEPSRVRSGYYWYTFTGWLAPALSLTAYVALRGEIEWLTL